LKSSRFCFIVSSSAKKSMIFRNLRISRIFLMSSKSKLNSGKTYVRIRINKLTILNKKRRNWFKIIKCF